MNIKNPNVNFDKTEFNKNVYYSPFYDYSYGYYRVYKVFMRYEAGYIDIKNIASYDYDFFHKALTDCNHNYALFGLKEIQIIKPRLCHINPEY
jgi:hypothetical protein